MTALRAAISDRPERVLAPPRVRGAGGASGLGSEQTAAVSFAQSASGGVDAVARVGDAALDPATTKLTLSLDLQANRKYSFSFYFPAGGPKVTLVDATGRKSTVNMSKGFNVPKGGTYQLTFEAGYSLKTAGFDNLAIKAKSVLPNSTGDRKLDALLLGGSGQWWHAFDGAAARGTDKVSATAFGLDAGSSATNLTYSFLTSAPSGQSMTGFQEMSVAQKDAVRRAFAEYAKLINVTFTEVQGDSAGDINFGTNVQASSAGYASMPNGNPGKDKVYMFLANNVSSSSDAGVQEGGYGYEAILHEIGHTLGLKHPGNYNAGGGSVPGPFLPPNEDDRNHSIMSYHDNNATRGVNPTTPMLYDVAALQYLYGANKNASTATNGAFAFTAGKNYVQTLWSASGADKIDLSGLTNSSAVDLNAGAYSSINITGPAASTYYSGNHNVAIAYGSQINSVTLSSAGGVAESVTLNKAFATGAFNTVGNFDASTDKIALKKSIFGALKATNIEFGAAATRSTSKIIVNASTGEIFYDADGSGTRSVAKKIAQYTALAGSTAAFSASNFSFVA